MSVRTDSVVHSMEVSPVVDITRRVHWPSPYGTGESVYDIIAGWICDHPRLGAIRQDMGEDAGSVVAHLDTVTFGIQKVTTGTD